MAFFNGLQNPKRFWRGGWLVLTILCWQFFSLNGIAAPLTGGNASLRLAQAEVDIWGFPQQFTTPAPKARPKPKRTHRRKINRRKVQRVRCSPPLVYDQKTRRCRCPEPGQRQEKGKCVSIAESCKTSERWDPEKKICSPVSSKSVSRQSPAVAATPSLPVVDQPVYDLKRIQSCLKTTGYFFGPVTGRLDRETGYAFQRFRKDTGLQDRPLDLFDITTQKRLFALCDRRAREQEEARLANRPDAGNGGTGATPTGGLAGTSGPHSKPSKERKALLKKGREKRKSPVRPKHPLITCLPTDLLQILRETYGKRAKAIKPCAPSCLPKPAEMTRAEAKLYEKSHGIRWCRECLRLTSYMTLRDVMRIEERARVAVCMAPQTRLMFARKDLQLVGPAFPPARDLYRDLTPSVGNPRNIAVIIGNRNYRDRIPLKRNGLRDAGAIYSLLTEHLGYTPDQIIDLRDATLADMNRVLGSDKNPKGTLWRWVEARPKGRVLVYFAGYGLSDFTKGESYLLPVDASPDDLAGTAYPLSRLYANLRRLGTRTVTVLLETNFGRDLSDVVLPPNAPEQKLQIVPASPVDGLTVIAATQGDQKALEDPDYGIGLFTRYVIEGLAGKADMLPVGNGDGSIETVELYVYVAHMVRLAARKSFGQAQSPIMGETRNRLLSRLQNDTP